jgi:hypothetical protein
VHLFAPRAAHRFRLDSRWDQNREGQVDNAKLGLQITYWLKNEIKDNPGEPAHPIKLEILDAQGQVVRTLSSVIKPNRYSPDDADDPEDEAKAELTTDAGLNRVSWDLRYESARRLEKTKIFPSKPDDAPLVLPGQYTLKLTVDGKTYTSAGTVLADPRSPVTPEQLQKNVEFSRRAQAALDRLADDIDEVRAIRAQTQDLRSRTAELPNAKELQAAAEVVGKRCTDLEERMYNPKAEVGYDVLAGRDGGVKLYSQIANLYTDTEASDRAPTQGQQEQLEENLADLKQIEDQLSSLRTEDLARLEAQAKALGLPRIVLPNRS